MTQPYPEDNNAIGGSHPGTKTIDEMSSNIKVEVDTSRTLQNVGQKITDSMDWYTTAFTDPERSPKYAVDPSVSYYGNGSLSLMARAGKFLFATNVNEANRGAFSLDHGESSMYSNLNKTTVGSLNIDTVDGYVLNPLCTTFPSTNFSPTKPWVKKLFPTLSSKNLMTIAILEMAQVLLFSIADASKGSSEKVSEKFESKDIATIIQDNKDLENVILGI